MKTYSATLVRIEHRVTHERVQANTLEEADDKFQEILEGGETESGDYLDYIIWGETDCVHVEEFIQDLKLVDEADNPFELGTDEADQWAKEHKFIEE